MYKRQVEERILEVIIDEVGHVSYNRMCLGSAGLAQARMLLPIVMLGLKDLIGETKKLGLTITPDAAALVETRSGLPEVVRKAAFVA